MSATHRIFRIFYGGTFDPVHDGHLAVANAAATVFDSDVILIPTGDPPHRPTPGASAEQRAAMLDLVVANHLRLRVDRRELYGDAPSYSVNTLYDIRSIVGSDASLVWLLGADAFMGLPTWYCWREMFALAHIVVAVRPGFDLSAMNPELKSEVETRWTADPDAIRNSPNGLVMGLDLPLRNESASDLRSRIAGGQIWVNDVPPAIAAYIYDHKLYGSAHHRR